MSDKVMIYAGTNFQGAYQELEPGKYDIFGNDKLSSLKVPAGIKVTVYEATGCEGTSKTFTSDVSWVGDDFKNKTSSINVETIAPVPGQELGLLVPVPVPPGVQQSAITPQALNDATTHTMTLTGTTLTSTVNDKNATVDLSAAFPQGRDVQTLTLTENVLGISNGNTIDLSTIPAIAQAAEEQTLAFDPATGDLTLSVTNSTVNISPTARNGLLTSGSVIELGQNLLHNTDIPSAGFNLTFSGDGKFGVGNNSPQQKLQITAAGNEGIRISRKDATTVVNRFEFCDTDGTTTKTKIEQNYNDDKLYFNVAGKDPFRLCPKGIAAFNAEGGIDLWGPSWSIDNSKSKLTRWGYNRPDSNPGDVITVYVPGNVNNGWEAINIFSSTQRVGINTSNPDQTLSISGNASKTGGGSFAALSDARAKTNITPYKQGLELIEQLSPVKFRYKPEFDAKGSEVGKQYVGFVAQELRKIAPSMVLQTQKGELSDLLMTDLSELTFTLVNAVKDLSDKVKTLEAQLAAVSG